MAPRRNHSNSNSSIVVHQQQLHHHQQQQQQQHQPASSFAAPSQVSPYYDGNIGNSIDDDLQQLHLNLLDLSGNMSPIHTTTANGSGSATAMLATIGNTNTNNNNNAEKFYRCCQPYGECFKPDSLISLSDQSLSDCVRVICNNENCQVGQYMHRACFEAWEQFLVMSMKTSGSRARAWTERQKAQNLWTKKGYELVYKSCGCKCGRGQLRKDVDWVAPLAPSSVGGASSPAHKQTTGSYGVTQQQQPRNGLNGAAGSPGEEDDKKKKKKRNRNSNSNSSNGTSAVNGSAKSMQQQNGAYSAMNGVQQQQQQQSHQMNGTMTNGSCSSNGGGDCSPTPNPNVGVIGSGLHHNNANNGNGNSSGNSSNVASGLLNSSNILGLNLRDRPRTLSSSSVGDGSGSTSPSDISHNSVDLMMSSMLQYQQHHPTLGLNAANAGQHIQHLQQYQQQQQQANGLTKSILNGCVNGSQLAKQQQPSQQNGTSLLSGNNGAGHLGLSSLDHQQFVQQQKVKQVELYSERVRITSGCNGIFSRRLDFSSFNSLPKTRLNSYQVKIEDEGNHGNDETRLFILSSLAQSQMSRVACILCEESMLVFDRYPLVDGSFFLSPKQHSTGCIEVKYEGRSLYLTCVCMRCLDGTSTSRIISCRFCGDIWDGSNLVLGTMYAYDIFAAMPCCAERLKCNNCFKLLLHPQHRLNFYSDYSHCVTCRFCSTQDTHFVKPLSYCYTKSSTVRHHPIA